jgi:hypothetical protein
MSPTARLAHEAREEFRLLGFDARTDELTEFQGGEGCREWGESNLVEGAD